MPTLHELEGSKFETFVYQDLPRIVTECREHNGLLHAKQVWGLSKSGKLDRGNLIRSFKINLIKNRHTFYLKKDGSLKVINELSSPSIVW